jgi:membrane-associated protease RseP (regulator of RpoE activity)
VFKVIFPIVRMFLKAKMKSRINNLGGSPLAGLREICADGSIPAELGGTLEVNHEVFVDQVITADAAAGASGGDRRTVAVAKVAGASLGIHFESLHVLPTDAAPPTCHTVVRVVSGSPAATAGVKVGDTIIAINGSLTVGISHDDVTGMFQANGEFLKLTLSSAAT